MEWSQIGLAVKAARTAAQVKSKDLADKAGITPSTLSKIEKGTQNLDFATAIAITESLNISIDDLASLAKKMGPISSKITIKHKELAKSLQDLERNMVDTALFLMNRK